jgi:Na+/H+-dicarboxylate symporter
MGNYTSESPGVEKSEGMNILGIVVFSVFLGAVIASMGHAGKPLLDFFEALHVATMKLTMLVIW